MMKAMEKRQEARKNQEKTLKRMMAYQKKAEQMVSRKGGIHGKLEKAKAEIKAKGADTIPKDKAKDLATVL